MKKKIKLLDYEISELIQMALSDDVPFSTLEFLYGLKEKDVKEIMRKELKPNSYRSWRKRVRTMGTNREVYK